MIIRGGENIYPREIEEQLYANSDIAEAAIVGVPDDYWGEQIACVVTIDNESNFDGEKLKLFIAEKLARHKRPEFWYRVDSLPMTLSGKVQKFRLVALIVAGELESNKF
jgi:fatty-acyl-CoA synthase